MTYQKINSSIASKGVMNSFKEMFPFARMFPLAVMHTRPGVSKCSAFNPFCFDYNYKNGEYDRGIVCNEKDICYFYIKRCGVFPGNFFFFLSGFSFTNIHDSQDSRGRGRVSI